MASNGYCKLHEKNVSPWNDWCDERTETWKKRDAGGMK